MRRTRLDRKRLRLNFTNNLTDRIYQLIEIRAAAEFGTDKQLTALLNNPDDAFEKYLRWNVTPSGLLDELGLSDLVTKDRKEL